MKIKRIVALVLALTMIFTFMAMTASASTVVARRATCHYCGGWDTIVISQSMEEINRWKVESCSSLNREHYHVQRKITARVQCRECYNLYDEITYSTTCSLY